MWTKRFWRDVAERTIKTMAQVAIVAFGLGEQGASLWTLDLMGGLGVTLAAGALSVLTSLASGYTGVKGTAQFGAGQEAYNYEAPCADEKAPAAGPPQVPANA